MDETLAFRIGREHDDYLVVNVLRRAHPQATDYWDGNWVTSRVTIAAGGFRGEYPADFRTNEFASFRDQLRNAYDTLVGSAVFRPMEPWLFIDVKGDGKGHFRAECRAADEPGIGNTLAFEIALDQTDMPEILRTLDALCEAFPVIDPPPSKPRL
jgi:hypothetical protein